MSLPATVQEYLETRQINYDLTHNFSNDMLNGGASTAVATLVVLKDNLGLVQVLIPRAGLLDLSALNQKYGRQWQARHTATAPGQKDHESDSDLHGQTAVPLLKDEMLFVDKRLLKLDAVYLESGLPDTFIKLSREEFSRLINDAQIDRYCLPLKPLIKATLDERQDESHLHQALETFTSLRIKSRLNETLEIPPLPLTVEKIIQLRINPEATIEELSEIVALDPSLSAQIVSWAASPFYAAPGKIRSIDDAIVRVLGFELVTNLALGLALGKTLQLPADHPYHTKPYWFQAITTATIMERLSQLHTSRNRPARGLAYLAGLLNNFGYLILGHVFPPHFSLLCRFTEANTHIPASYIDQHLFGMTRDQISSQLMSSWQLPEEIVRAIRWQQFPAYQGSYANYANLLCLTHHLTALQQESKSSCLLTELQLEKLYERMDITPSQAAKVVEEVLEDEDSLQAFAQNFE